jgi:hypothetical protein
MDSAARKSDEFCRQEVTSLAGHASDAFGRISSPSIRNFNVLRRPVPAHHVA